MKMLYSFNMIRKKINYKKEIKFKVSLIFSLFLIILIINLTSAKGFYYNIELYYNGSVLVKDINVEFSNEELSNLVNERYFKTYEAWVLNKNNEKIKDTKFGIINKAYYDILGENEELVDGGLIEFENVSLNIYIPYYENAEKIVIYDDNGEKAYEKEVKMFSPVVYEPQESLEEREVFYKEILKEKNKNWFFYLIAFLLILFLIYILLKTKKS